MPSIAAKKPNRPSHIQDLFLLFAIPTAIVIIAALVIYIPQLLANPQSDFIYATCSDYSCPDTYSVDSSGQVYLTPNKAANQYYASEVSLRYYDASSDATRSLTLEQARQYHLNTLSKSPDGYTLTGQGSGGGFLFWGDDNDGWYLKNGAKKQKIELTASSSYGAHNVTFLGWVNR